MSWSRVFVCVLGCVPVAAGAGQALGTPGEVQTIRYDLVSAPLAVFNLSFFVDGFFPGDVDGKIVGTRVHLEFHTQTAFGDFDASNFGLTLLAPIMGDGQEVGNHSLIGSELGWSGSGVFTFDSADFPTLSGDLLPVGPGEIRLYGFDYFNAHNLSGPPDLQAMGGQLVGSYVDVDYVLVPAPTALSALGVLGVLGSRRRRGA